MPYARAEKERSISVTGVPPVIPAELLWIIAPAILGLLTTLISKT